MKTLVKKMSNLGLLKFDIIIGTVYMVAVAIGFPASMIYLFGELILNPTILGITLIGTLFFLLVGYFCFLRTYILYRKYPLVQAETDGEFLYIHAKKEAKIPLSDLAGSIVRVELPYILQKDFLREIIINIFSSEYGNIVLEVPGYGSYKMRYIAYSQNTASELVKFIEEVSTEA